MKEALQNLLMWLVDTITALVPQTEPDREALLHCRLVSHRGEHDNRRVYENTLAAFEAARAAGVWGIELDIRWTADLVPVVIHDPCGTRVFGNSSKVRDLSFAELRARLPLVPSLEEVIEQFGNDLHLMIEIKDEHYPEPGRQMAILQELLVPLVAGEHYHFLSLDTALFKHAGFAPRAAMLPVAEFNVHALSDWSLDQKAGGITGHYLLLSNAVQARHEAVGQHIGTGHIGSRNALFRELNRGVAWIFSNNAVEMQQLRDSLLD